MIKSKKFKSETSLNEFIQQNDIKVISVETEKEKYDTGLPMPKGGSFIIDRDIIKLWYEDSEF